MRKIFMFVNVDWFFLSHRLPIAKAALKNDINMVVYTDFTKAHEANINKGFIIYQSPLRRVSKSIFHLLFEFINCWISHNRTTIIYIFKYTTLSSNLYIVAYI